MRRLKLSRDRSASATIRVGSLTLASLIGLVGLASCGGRSAKIPTGIVDPVQSTVVATPQMFVQANGTDPVTITVTVIDTGGVPIGGAAVTIAVSGQNNTLTPTNATTDAAGQAQATLTTTTAETKTVSVTVSRNGTNYTLASKPSVVFSAAAGSISSSLSSVTVSVATGVIADGVQGSTITVTVRDGLSNPLVSVSVTFTAPGATVVAAAGFTDSNGVVTATITSTTSGTKTITVQATPFFGGATTQLDDQPTVSFVGNPATIDATNTTLVASPTSGIMANGVAVSTVTVTVKDALSNPVAGQTVTISSNGTGNTITQPASTTDQNGVVTGTIKTTVAETKTISGLVNPGASQVAITQTAAVTFITTEMAADDARLIHGEGAASAIRTRDWDDSVTTWSGETTIETSTSTLQWSVVKVSDASPSEQLVATLLSSGTVTSLDIRRFNGVSWDTEWSSAAITSANAKKRGFDMEFEQTANELLVVYSNNTSTPMFRTWNGTTWSTAAALPLNDGGGGPNPDPNTGIVEWIELTARPGGNEIALVYSDANADLVAIVWDGANWVTASVKTLETSVKTNPTTSQVSNRAFDCAYEATTGDLLVCWAKAATNGFQYDRKAVGGNVWDGAVGVATAPGSTPHFIDLCGQPGSDRIGGVFAGLGDGTERLGLAMWTGTAWTDAGEYDSQIRNVNDNATGDFPAAIAWVGTTDVAVCVFADHDNGGIDWVKWDPTNGWVVQSDFTITGKGFTDSVFMQTFGAQNKLMTIVMDANDALYALTYDGTAWTTAVLLETSLPVRDAVPFGFAIRGARPQ